MFEFLFKLVFNLKESEKRSHGEAEVGSENRCSEAYRRERRVVGSSSSSWLRDTLDANLQFKFDFFTNLSRISTI